MVGGLEQGKSEAGLPFSTSRPWPRALLLTRRDLFCSFSAHRHPQLGASKWVYRLAFHPLPRPLRRIVLVKNRRSCGQRSCKIKHARSFCLVPFDQQDARRKDAIALALHRHCDLRGISSDDVQRRGASKPSTGRREEVGPTSSSCIWPGQEWSLRELLGLRYNNKNFQALSVLLVDLSAH